jgi:hypothetical protein
MRQQGWRDRFLWGWWASVCTVIPLGWLAGAGMAAEKQAPAARREAVGNPLAPSLMPLLEQEIQSDLKTRGIEGTFQQFRSYVAAKLDSTAGDLRTSEVTGNCRLSWYDHLLRNPIHAATEAEQFTRELHQALRGNHEGLARAIATARTKMDLGQHDPRPVASPKSPEEALEAVKQALTAAQAGYAAALAPLGRGELGELVEHLYPVFTSHNRNGHTLETDEDRRRTGPRLCDLMEKMDRGGFYDAAEALAPLVDPSLLKQLAALPDQGNVKVPGVTGTVVRQIVTPSGTIVIGGKGKNTYDLEKMEGVNVVIDLGGDDVYREGTVNFQRPVLILIDLDGNDRYEGAKPGIQGGAVMGISMLIDVAGNDVYRAQDVAQGSALCGVGILVDFAGDDQYLGLRRCQGQALGGLGILLDRAGRDRYHAAMWAQGFGAPLGFGVLEDLDGNDHYY